MDAHSLSLFWAGLLAFSLLYYVVLDGYDLGVGILFGLAGEEDFRTGMINSIAPFWDGNEVWLVLIGAGLFGAFPTVYGVFLSAFYLPVALMLAGLIFRGVAFEFRDRSRSMRGFWGWGFSIGSFLAAFVQGAAIGRLSEGIPVVNGQYMNLFGGTFDWLSPFSVLCGFGLVFGYCLLGASWLVLKKTGPIQEWAFRRLPFFLIVSVILLIVAVAVTLKANGNVAGRWSSPAMLIFPALLALSCLGLFIGERKKIEWLPYAMSVLFFATSFLALAVSFWPYMIPYSVTVDAAAAPVETLRFLFYGAGIVVFPVILIYTAAVYWMLRGKQ